VKLLYGHDAAVAAFVSALIWRDERRVNANAKTIGVIDDEGRLIAGFAFFDWEPREGLIEVAAAAVSPRWATRAIIHTLFAYAFETCGCQMLIERIAADNERALKFNMGLGFVPQRVRRLYGRHQDGYLMTLTAEEWRREERRPWAKNLNHPRLILSLWARPRPAPTSARRSPIRC
jgi:RimJ/RimL family protein N-acetyltransferase